MEDIYGNLENYEEENVIDELKSENKELKFKLEEYASTINNLQKDFDKLSSEYKKLELNYSSLLKTAKAEIERKTKIITNLNLEKDQLVINAFQRGGRIPSNLYNKNKPLHNKENTQQKEQQTSKADSKKLNDDESLLDPVDKCASTKPLNNERKVEKGEGEPRNIQDKTMISSDLALKLGSDKEKESKSKLAEDPDRYRDKYKRDTKEIKENPTNDVVAEQVKDKISRIRQRRKSMPLLNRGDIKFSSDEEQEDKTDNIREHRIRRKSPFRDVIDRRYGRDRNNRYGPKEPPFSGGIETARGDDKIPNHRDSVRDNYYKSNSRYNDSDWYRRQDTRDRYDTRFKSRTSTDKWRSNTHKEYSKDQSHRHDYGRHRVTVSSPPEKHNYLHKSRDLDRSNYRNDEVYGYKHKIHDITDEPSYKRLRTESPKRQPDENIMQNDGNMAFQADPVTQAIPYSSLQSPDYLDPHPAHKIREIKNTAATKLDDPRLKSSKYVVNTHNNKVTLSTVVGRNIELQYVNKDLWDVGKGIWGVEKMPTPLREKPHFTDDIISQIYMDIKNPISNSSLESGEVDSADIEDLPFNNVDTDKNLNVTKGNVVDTNIFNLKCDQPDIHKLECQNQTNCTKIQTDTSEEMTRKYRIPLLNKPNPKLQDLTTNTKNEGKKDNLIRQCNKKSRQEEKREIGNNKQLDCKPKKLNSNNRRSTKNKTKEPELQYKEPYVDKKIISIKDTVEGDLELSDETSDCTESVDPTRYSQEKPEECPREPVIVRIPKEILKEHSSDTTSNQQGVFHNEIEKLRKSKNAGILKLDTDAQFKESMEQEELKSNKNILNMKENTKAKLCDLFGDSSSLITPDDLGLVVRPAVNPIDNKYSPFFDNTQDAVDLNVDEMEKVQTRSSKITHGKTDVNSDQQDVKQDKKQKNKSNKANNERKKDLKNIQENISAAEHSDNFKRDVLNKESNVVKTVIISSGVQNSCQDQMPDKRQEFFPNSLSLPNLNALATSTPHKMSLTEPSLSVPESSGTASNTISTNSSNLIQNAEDSHAKTSQTNLDVPEFRLVVKRRRKARAPN